MSERPYSLLLANEAKGVITGKYSFADDWIETAAAELRRQHELIQEMRKALDIAKQFMTCASDWNFDEAEINGEMVATFDLIERMESVIAKAEEQK